MSKFSQSLAQLKLAISQQDNLADIMELFLQIADEPGFRAAGDFVDHPMLKTLIETIAKNHLDIESPELSELVVKEFESDQFFHGICFINHQTACVIYFRDIDMGVVQFINNPFVFDDSMSHFFRFSVLAHFNSSFLSPVQSKLKH